MLAADRAPADAVGAPGGGAVAAPPAPATPAPRPRAGAASDGGPSAEALLAETFAAALKEHVARTGGEDDAPRRAAEEEDAMPAARMLHERREETMAYTPPAPPPTRGANASGSTPSRSPSAACTSRRCRSFAAATRSTRRAPT